MKNLILTLFTICMLNPFFAQIKTPQPSPTCTIQQTVGVTEVSITYSDQVQKAERFLAT